MKSYYFLVPMRFYIEISRYIVGNERFCCQLLIIIHELLLYAQWWELDAHYQHTVLVKPSSKPHKVSLKSNNFEKLRKTSELRVLVSFFHSTPLSLTLCDRQRRRLLIGPLLFTLLTISCRK